MTWYAKRPVVTVWSGPPLLPNHVSFHNSVSQATLSESAALTSSPSRV